MSFIISKWKLFFRNMFSTFSRLFAETIGSNEDSTDHNRYKPSSEPSSSFQYYHHNNHPYNHHHHHHIHRFHHPPPSLTPIITRPLDYSIFQKRSGYEDPSAYSSYGGLDKSDLYYVLPILMVIALGAFLIPIITTFFTAVITSQSAYCGYKKRVDNGYPFSVKSLLHQRASELKQIFDRAFNATINTNITTSGGQ